MPSTQSFLYDADEDPYFVGNYREKDESDSESSSDTSSENEENDVESDCYYDMNNIESDQEPAAFGSPTTNQQQEEDSSDDEPSPWLNSKAKQRVIKELKDETSSIT